MTRLIETTLFTLLFLLLARQRPLRECFAAIDPVRRTLLLALVALIPLGQLVDHNEWSYPWVVWSMYTERRPGDVKWREYTAVLASDREVAWPVARQFDRIGKKVVWKLNTLDQEGRSDLSDRILVSAAVRWNAAHTDDPITAIRVWEDRLPIGGAPGMGAVEHTFVREVTFDGHLPAEAAKGR